MLCYCYAITALIVTDLEVYFNDSLLICMYLLITAKNTPDCLNYLTLYVYTLYVIHL